MTDLFALLGQPRRPWLDAEAVQQAFIAAAREVHPDRTHEADAETRQAAQARYTRLNEARQRLSSHHTRLRHLLELERGRQVSDLQSISGDVMELFSTVGRASQAADGFLAERAQTTSPLLKVALVERGEEIRAALETARREVLVGVASLEGKLKAVDANWGTASADGTKEAMLTELEQLFRLFSFHERWQAQLQTRWVQLAA